MLAITDNKLLAPIISLVLYLSVVTAQAEVSLTDIHHAHGKYKYQVYGQISDIDKSKRQITIATNNIKQENNKNFLTIQKKTYEIAVGARLKNVSKTTEYSGLKNLMVGAIVYINLQKGTEKKPVPTISEMWVDLR